MSESREHLGRVQLRWCLVSATASGTAFVVLSFLVAIGATRDLDATVRQTFRPDDVWSTNQLIFGNVVDGLGPPVAVGILLVSGLVASWRRRSPVPLMYVGALGAVAVVITAVAKMCVHQVDPHGGVGSLGGAYPSGHMVILLVSLSGAVLVLRAHSRWWDWLLVAALEVLMGISLLFLAMHWFTDVVGGALLGLAIVSLASLACPRWETTGPAPSVQLGRSHDLT